MSIVPLAGNEPNKEYILNHVKFWHALDRIQHIDIMSRIEFFYTSCQLGTQTVVPTLPSFQGIKICIKYLDTHPHKPILYLSNSYDG